MTEDAFVLNSSTVTQERSLSIADFGQIQNNAMWRISGANSGVDINAAPNNPGRFANFGTFESAGPSRDVSPLFSNFGTVRVTGGELALHRPFTSDGGSFEVQNGSLLTLNAYVNSNNDTTGLQIPSSTTATGTGTVEFSGGPHRIWQGGTLTATIDDGGNPDLNGLWLDGEVEIDGQLANQAKLTWNGLATGSGDFVNLAGGTVLIGIGAELETTFRNLGTVEQAGNLTVRNGTVENFNNTAEWILRDNSIIDGGLALFDNSGGTLRKTGSSAAELFSSVTAVYRQRNGGRVVVDGPSGADTSDYAVTFTGGGQLFGGRFTVEQEVFARMQNWFWVLSDGITFDGLGTVSIMSGTSLLIPGGEQAIANMTFAGVGHEGFLLDGGAIGDLGSFVNEGRMTFRAGIIGVDDNGVPIGHLVNNGVLIVPDFGTATVRDRLTNNADGRIDVNRLLQLDDGRLFNEGGVVNLNTGTIAGTNGGAIFNDGMLRANEFGTSSSTSIVSADLDNSGQVVVFNGKLFLDGEIAQLQNGCLTGGTWAVNPGAELLIPTSIECLQQGAFVVLGGSMPAIDQLVENLGTLETEGGNTVTIDPLDPEGFFNGGIFGIDAATIELPNDGVLNEGLIETSGGGIIDVGGEIENGIMGELSQSLVISLKGGSFGGYFCTTLFNNGTLRPGDDDAAGPFYLEGNLESGQTNIIDVELGGNVAIEQYDQVIVDGDVMLDGTLTLSLIAGFEPAGGESFVILSSTGTISGQFESVDTTGLGGRSVSVDYSPSAVTVTIGQPAELVDFAFIFGQHLTGDLSYITTSDDTYLTGRSQFGFTATEPNIIELRVEMNARMAVVATLSATGFEALIDHADIQAR